MLHGHPQCRASNQVHAKARGVWILAGKNLKPLRSARNFDCSQDRGVTSFLLASPRLWRRPAPILVPIRKLP